ncbi:hypothetical protein F0562_001528 [Nyssa sinensis]|uniref:F-box domain-containing protein n=1 Tax=Nyssa sinensis TaxID=561372 RepID=A0A5J5C4T3_9ASTE|nr:hypothetical protein F0562_001528 [Nyssa sinensis]
MNVDSSSRRMDELPFDIIINIFSRIPVKSLLQLRCVSKLWCNFIDHPSLANMHLKQAAEEPTILLLSEPTRKSNTIFQVHLVKQDCNILKACENPIGKFDLNGCCSLESSCNGLFCFVKYANQQSSVLLLNPLRKDHVQLATTTSLWPCYTKYGLGFDGSTQKYKIVHVFFQELDSTCSHYNLGVEVFTMGTKSWREISKAPPYPIRGKAVFAHGALHWIVHPLFAGDNLKRDLIVSFDIEKEEFNLTPHPGFQFKDCKLFHLVDLNGDLSLVDLSSNTDIEIWVLKDYDKKVWVKEYRIEIRPPIGIADNGHAEVLDQDIAKR